MIKSLYKQFQHWSEKGSVYIISDPHFDDADCPLMNPNWIPAADHVKKINETVHKNDTLICLGDCGDLEYFKQIKAGYKILIKGNHDDKGDSKYYPYFDEVYDGPLFISSKLLLSHEPVIGLPFCHNLHGHVHNGKRFWIDELGGTHLNFASDVTGWEVWSLGTSIKGGLLSEIDNIHRITIDKATANSIKR